MRFVIALTMLLLAHVCDASLECEGITAPHLYIPCEVTRCRRTASPNCDDSLRWFDGLDGGHTSRSTYAMSTAYNLMSTSTRTNTFSPAPTCDGVTCASSHVLTMNLASATGTGVSWKSNTFPSTPYPFPANGYTPCVAFPDSADTQVFIYDHELHMNFINPCTAANLNACIIRLCLNNNPGVSQPTCTSLLANIDTSDSQQFYYDGWRQVSGSNSNNCPNPTSAAIPPLVISSFVAVAGYTEIIRQCEEGYVLRNSSGVFAGCEDNRSNQCVQATSTPGNVGTWCAGHGTCAFSWPETYRVWALTNSPFNDVVNDLRMLCTCEDGYATIGAGGYCATETCLDQWGVNSKCAYHGTCTMTATDIYSCVCGVGWTGESCQWPLRVNETVAPVGSSLSISSAYAMKWTYFPTIVAGAIVTATESTYSLSFANGNSVTALTEPVSQITTYVYLDADCNISPIALFAGTTSVIPLVRSTDSDAYVQNCMSGPCRLPFQRDSAAPNLCLPPAEVAVVPWEAGVVYCAQVTDPTLVPVMESTDAFFHCWTPAAFGVAPNTVAAFELDCAFVAKQTLWTLMRASLGGFTWQRLYAYMLEHGCT